MKRFIPLIVLLLASCAPGAQEPMMLEPAAPLEEPAPAPELPSTEAPAAAPTGPVVTQLEPPEVEAPATPGIPDAPEVVADPEEADPEAATEAPAEVSSAPQGTIAISSDGETFSSGSEEPVTVTAGESFTLRLEFSDPDGISEVQVELRNSANAGPLPTGPFTIASNDCDAQLTSIPTEISCTVEVAVALEAQPIAEAGESAYAFRPSATDSLGNSALPFSWGYLIVEPL